MKPFISTKLFGLINWACAILLISSPWTFGLANYHGGALLMPLLLGWLQLLMAIFSNTPNGIIKVFELQMHTILLVITGSFLLCMPWTYAFANQVFWPHLIFGAIMCINGIFVHKSPFLVRSTAHLHEAGFTSEDSLEGRLDH
jgi:hypothetical protein